MQSKPKVLLYLVPIVLQCRAKYFGMRRLSELIFLFTTKMMSNDCKLYNTNFYNSIILIFINNIFVLINLFVGKYNFKLGIFHLNFHLSGVASDRTIISQECHLPSQAARTPVYK